MTQVYVCKLCLAVAALLVPVGAYAETLNLDFTPGNGITCEGGGSCFLQVGFIDQTYGDIASKLDVQWDSLLNQSGLDRFAFGQVSQPAANFGGFSSSGTSTPGAEVFLQPLPGYKVTLNSFTLRTNIGKNPSQPVEILSADGANTLFSSALGFVFSSDFTPNLTSSDGLRIRFVGDGQQTYIDDINYTVAPVPIPAAVWLMASALTGLGMLGRNWAV